MAIPVLQHAFHSGEWAPELYARVDLQKYKAGAALLRNFYVDYRGGASTRQGTRFCNRAFSAGPRLIPFQASSFTSYILEFGNGYIRFFSNGSPVLETAFNVSAISGNSVTAAGNNFNAGDWVFIGSSYYIVLVAGGTFTVSDLWGNATILPAITGTTAARVYTLASPFLVGDLFPNPNTGNPGIKYTQNVNSMILCHPNYQPQILNIIAPNNWTISSIKLGSTVTSPTSITVTTTLGALSPGWNYSYAVTAVDNNNQESPATTGGISNFKSLNDATAPGTNNIAWSAVAGAASYNVYKADPTFNTAIAAGVPYGFIGNVTGTSMQDATPGIAPDFAQSIPIVQNPFLGAPVIGYTVTVNGTYTAVPTVAVTGGGGTGAAAQASLGVTVATINSHGASLFDIYVKKGSPAPTNALMTCGNGVVIQATTVVFKGTGGVDDFYEVTAIAIFSAGSITVGTTPSNPVVPVGCSAIGFDFFDPAGNFNFNFTWGVTQVNATAQGSGYTSVPSVAFSAGAAAATAILGTSGAGGLPNVPANPAVPAFLQERLVFGNLVGSPMSIEMSQPSSFFNFNISNPIQPDDAISVTIFSGELNDIRSMTPVPTGLLVLSGRLAWILNGGGGLSAYNPITPSTITANPQTFTGANDLPPLKIAQDILYCTNKGNYVRDLNYNIYANVFAGQDISALATHLFFGYYLIQWTWAEEPFKTMWALRSDGDLLSLTYVKDQEVIGWAHHDTNGFFTSVASVLEINNGNTVDAVYVVTAREINGGAVSYIERIADRFFLYGMEDSWSVDCALRTTPNTSTTQAIIATTGDVRTVGNTVTITDLATQPFTPSVVGWVMRIGGGIFTIATYISSSQVTATVTRVPTLLVDAYTGLLGTQGGELWKPVTTVGGLQHLLGQQVVGVADGTVIGPLTVSASGTVTLPGTFTKVVLGLAFTPQLQTLPLDVATQPTVQGRPKVINAVSVRCANTLGLSIGAKFSTLVTMKDLVLGNLNYYLNTTVTDLTNADARTLIDSTYTIPGQYCIQQNNPYPATVLGVIPEFEASK